MTEVGGSTKLFGEVYVKGSYEQLKLLSKDSKYFSCFDFKYGSIDFPSFLERERK